MPDLNRDIPAKDAERIRGNANQLSAKLYALIQAQGNPTLANIGVALAALAHVTALVATTHQEHASTHLAIFLSLLGQNILNPDDPNQTTH